MNIGRRLALVVGWLLVVPGFVMLSTIAIELILANSSLVDCRSNFMTGASGPRCPGGSIGTAIEIALFAGGISRETAAFGYGLIPMIYSVIFVAVRWALTHPGGRN